MEPGCYSSSGNCRNNAFISATENFIILFWSPESPFHGQLNRDVESYFFWVLMASVLSDFEAHSLWERPNPRHPDLGSIPFLNNLGVIRSNTSPHSLQFLDSLGVRFTWQADKKRSIGQKGSDWYVSGGPYALSMREKWRVEFPSFSGLNLNMFPIDLLRLGETVPVELNPYLSMIEQCCSYLGYGPTSNGRLYSRRFSLQYNRSPSLESSHVAYLTIDERAVPMGRSHRRAGIHTDSPGMYIDFTEEDRKTCFVSGSSHPWGRGNHVFLEHFHVEDGIFIASNVDRSSRLWNVSVKPELIGTGGNCEHLRKTLESLPSTEFIPKANEMWWITDCTPHESLPLKEGTQRQFFRLVVGPIDVWYSQHSTANPLCKLPESVKVINSNKFSGGEAQHDSQGNGAENKNNNADANEQGFSRYYPDNWATFIIPAGVAALFYWMLSGRS